jgi:hypothetical protein
MTHPSLLVTRVLIATSGKSSGRDSNLQPFG